MRRLAALLIIISLTGCKGGGQHEPDAGHGSAEADPFVAHCDAQFERAAKDLAQKVAERDARGWPKGVPLSSEQPARPVVRIGDLMNNSTRNVDMTKLEELAMKELTEGGKVKVLAKGVPSTDGPFMELVGSLEEDRKDFGDVVESEVAVTLRIVTTSDRGVVVQSRTESRITRER